MSVLMMLLAIFVTDNHTAKLVQSMYEKEHLHAGSVLLVHYYYKLQ